MKICKSVTKSIVLTIILVYSTTSDIIALPSVVDGPSRSLNTNLPVGSLPGQLNVDFSGNSTYSFQIELPPSKNNLCPSIGVSYNSQNRNSFLGWGWSLFSGSVISRGKTSIIQDGYVDGADFDSNDRLYLNGSRLILVSGTYGSNGSEYRTEEESHKRVIMYGTGTSAYFKVWTPDGKLLEIGNGTSYKINASEGTLFWYQNKLEDYSGNVVTYAYINDSNGYRISEILFSGNSVQFNYDVRPDKNSLYFQGEEIKRGVRLSNIKVYGQGTLFRQYAFNYYTDFYSLLNEIIVTGDNGTQFNSTIVNWNTMGSISSNMQKFSISSSDIFLTGDFNGDGREDYLTFPNKDYFSTGDYLRVYVNNGDGLSSTLKHTKSLYRSTVNIEVADFDNDLIDEIFIVGRLAGPDGDGETFWNFYQLNGTSLSNESSGDYIGSGDWAKAGDIDGDGNEDIVLIDYMLGIDKIIGINSPNFPSSGGGRKLELMDFNQDGKKELFILSTSTLSVYEYNPGSQDFSLILQTSVVNKDSNFKLGDFNGDGNTDILNVSSRKLYLSTQVGLTEVSCPLAIRALPINDWETKVEVGDFNGDGKDDILDIGLRFYFIMMDRWSESDNYIHYSNGSSFQTESCNQINGMESFIGYLGTNYDIKILDSNGDGADDILAKFGGDPKYDCYLSNKYSYGLMISSVTSGVNLVERVDYSYLNDGTGYNEVSSTNADLCFRSKATSVVSNISRSHDGQTLDNLTYTYENATYNKKLGFIGFTQVKSTNSINDVSIIKDFTTIGEINVPVPESQQMKVGGNSTSTATFDYSFVKNIKSGGFTYSIRPLTKQNTDHLTSLVNTINYLDFDTYDNATEYEEKDGTLVTKTVNSTFDNLTNSTYWIIGRPALVTVKHSGNGDTNRTEKTQFIYDNQLLKTKTDFYGTSKAVKTTFNYTNNLLTSEVTSGSGVTSRATSYTWDTSNRFIETITNPLGHQVTNNYDQSTGNLLSSSDPNNLTTSYAYDGFGNLINTQWPTGGITHVNSEWDNSVTNAFYKVIYSETGSPDVVNYYNIRGQVLLTQTTDNQGRTKNILRTYDAKGRISSESLPYFNAQIGSKSFSYDGFNRIETVSLPNGRGSISYSYFNLVTTVTNPEGWEKTTLDAAGQLEQTETSAGIVNYDYFSNGLLKSQTSGGHVVSYQYDVQGNVETMTDSDIGISQASNNAYGEIISSTDPNGNTYSFTYDNLGRISTRTLSGGSESTSWEYDPSGHLGVLSKVKVNGLIQESYGYDSYHRVNSLTKTVRFGGVVKNYNYQMNYTPGNKLSTLTYPGGYRLTYTYDTHGYLASINDNKGKFSWSNPEFNELGQPVSYSYGNGATTSFSYDSRYRLDQVSASTSSTTLMNMDYDFDIKGNLTKRKDLLNNQEEVFTYDAQNRLSTSTIGADISYNSANQISTKSDIGTYQYGHSSKPNAITGVTNLASGWSPNNQDVSYTPFQKVSEITNYTSSGDLIANFSYGFDHNRQAMEVSKGGNILFTKFYAGKLFEEIKETGEKYHYIYLNSKIIGMYMEMVTSSDVYYAHTDHLGSIVCLSDASGSIAEEYSYDAWGSRRDPGDWTSPDNRTSWLCGRGFTGHEHLNDFGLINMNGRVYDNETGLFLSPDPYLQDPSNPLNFNRYSYVLNNPLKYTDPTGYKTYIMDELWVNPGAERMLRFSGPRSGGGFYGGPGLVSNGTGLNGVYYDWFSGTHRSTEDGSEVEWEYLVYVASQYKSEGWYRQDAYVGSGGFYFYKGSVWRKSTSDGQVAANSGVTPFDVGVEWLTGTGPRHRDFTNGDVFTEMLRQHDHVLNTLASIPGMIANGKMRGNAPYSLSGVQGVGKYVKDYSTLATGGLTGNLAVTYLGSYNLAWQVTGVNGNSATVEFLVNNSSTIQSATRPPVLGYYSWWQNSVGSWINSSFSSGPMSPTTQTFRWTETVTW
ncbi:FG-GAP-like repeat-containing protein [Marinilabilia sp.]|uniref:FG-GAP-like repeat-containing protein n=2 Tax=Marinilabilia sp. TaxID=2021252 RepID=UPI0025BEAD71|nr:FG-GAP-like repeat-containing protein [Marinilabilia sp.]